MMPEEIEERAAEPFRAEKRKSIPQNPRSRQLSWLVAVFLHGASARLGFYGYLCNRFSHLRNPHDDHALNSGDGASGRIKRFRSNDR